MAFIDVVYRGLQTQSPQRAIAANAEQHFLLQSSVAIAAVQLVGDVPVFGPRVGLQVAPSGYRGAGPTCTCQTCVYTDRPGYATWIGSDRPAPSVTSVSGRL